MSYCIMRMDKKKSTRDVVMTLDHNNRERQPQNADPEKAAQNKTFGGSTAEAMNRHHERMPAKIRKNGVLAVELVFTASPDFSGDWDKYLLACDHWAADLFGEKNLLHIAHHHDELTPHSHIIFNPMKDGKLNAKYFIGGHRDRMAELQSDFFEKVGKQFGLERGKPREETRAKHTHPTLAAKAAELNEREQRVEDREVDVENREENVRDREIALGEAEGKLSGREAAINLALQDLPQSKKIMTMLAENLHGEPKPVIEKFWPRLIEKAPDVKQEIKAELAAARQNTPTNTQEDVRGGRGRG